MADLRLANLAVDDLEAIRVDGEAAFGTDRVRRHLAGFERIFGLLRTHPLGGQERPELGTGIRSFSHRPHRLLYRVDGDMVTVLRIIHAAQDISRVTIQ